MTAIGERVLRARLQLMLDRPFLASAVARLPLVEMPAESWCQTAATDGFRILWNPKFFADLADHEIAGVLAHEVMHVVLGHIERRGARQPELWNQAIDHATNLLLLEHGVVLPKMRLADVRYRDMTAEQIYIALLTRPLPLRPVLRVVAPAISATARRPRIGNRRRAIRDNSEPLTAAGDPTRDADALKDEVVSRGFDDHLDPGDPRLDGLMQATRPSPMELARIRHGLQHDMREELARSSPQGMVPGEFVEAAIKAERAHTPWQVLLARCFGGFRRDDYRLLPPSRRHLWRGVYLPSVGVPGPRLVVCAIDTSGSIGGKLAARFLAEVHALRSSAHCCIKVVQCDARITKVSTFESWETPSNLALDEKLIGRGGTDFRPVFEWISSEVVPREGAPDLLAYLTDGFGTMPSAVPIYPTVWLVPEGSKAIVPFGVRIELPAE